MTRGVQPVTPGPYPAKSPAIGAHGIGGWKSLEIPRKMGVLEGPKRGSLDDRTADDFAVTGTGM